MKKIYVTDYQYSILLSIAKQYNIKVAFLIHIAVDNCFSCFPPTITGPLPFKK